MSKNLIITNCPSVYFNWTVMIIKQGKIRVAGVSNYDLSHVQYVVETTQIASNQFPYNVLNRSIKQDQIPYSLAKNISFITYSPMEIGLLTGKYFKEDKLRKNNHYHNYFKKFDLNKLEIFLNSIAPIAAYKNATLSQWVLCWTALQPGITVLLAVARNAEQATSNEYW